MSGRSKQERRLIFLYNGGAGGRDGAGGDGGDGGDDSDRI